MSEAGKPLLARIPSIDRLLQSTVLAGAIAAHGRTVVVEAARDVLDEVRDALLADGEAAAARAEEAAIGAAIAERAATRLAPSLSRLGPKLDQSSRRRVTHLAS